MGNYKWESNHNLISDRYKGHSHLETELLKTPLHRNISTYVKFVWMSTDPTCFESLFQCYVEGYGASGRPGWWTSLDVGL